MLTPVTVNESGMVYLACPYSHESAEVRRQRFERANLAAAKLMSEGHYVFSPISHSHPILESGNLPTEWSYWQNFCRLHLRNCYAIMILRLLGWESSIGIKEELTLSFESNRSVCFLDEDYGVGTSKSELFWASYGQTNIEARSERA